MTAHRALTSLAVSLGLAMTLTACSSGSDTATESPAASPESAATGSVGAATEDFCASTASVKDELADLRALVTGGSITVEGLQAQREELATVTDQLKADSQALGGTITAEVTTARTAFQVALDAIPDDQTGAAAVAAYVAAGAVFVRSLDLIDDQVGCS
jgi:hypothetical protein